MLKKPRGGGERNGCGRLALTVTCLLLLGTAGCAKQKSAAAHHAPAANGFGADPAMVAEMAKHFTSEEKALRDQQMERIKAFSSAKAAQARTLAGASNEKVSSEAQRFFDAAKGGDTATEQTMFKDFAKRHRQYAHSSNDASLDTAYWPTMIEIQLAYETVPNMDPKSVQYFVDDTINSIPAGSIYFGGTDTGRGLITAFTKSHAEGDPFFTLTQNALADAAYLTYLRQMYGAKISIPTADESAKCFNDYMMDTQTRLKHDQSNPGEPRQIKPGEDVRAAADGRVSISGQTAVMQINGLIAKMIFDHNPDREFYVEESFPLEWMYPYLEPHGVILKLNHDKRETLSESILTDDREYWHKRVSGMIGDWLTEDTPVQMVTEFVEKVYVRKDLRGFTGGKSFIESQDSQKMFAKLRASIGGVYEWHRHDASSGAEKDRMLRAADLAYREAFALCPYSPETVFRNVTLLIEQKRYDDAIRIVSASLDVAPGNQQMQGLLTQVRKLTGR